MSVPFWWPAWAVPGTAVLVKHGFCESVVSRVHAGDVLRVDSVSLQARGVVCVWLARPDGQRFGLYCGKADVTRYASCEIRLRRFNAKYKLQLLPRFSA